MGFASTVSPERRAGLRRLRAEFDAAFDAMGGLVDPSTPAYREADARYRAWIRALDGLALALLDDIDACEALESPEGAGMRGPVDGGRARRAAGPSRVDPAVEDGADVDRLFSGLDEARCAVDLIDASPPRGAAQAQGSGTVAARARAMSVVGHDRAARHWRLSLGVDGPDREDRSVDAARPRAAVAAL